MIVDRIERLQQYSRNVPQLFETVKFAERVKNENLPAGRYNLGNDFVLVQEGTTRSFDEAAFAAVDAAAKAGGVVIEAMERTRQGCNVCIRMRGDVASVTAAVEAVRKEAECKIFASYVIANPHPETQRFLCRSEGKIKAAQKQ